MNVAPHPPLREQWKRLVLGSVLIVLFSATAVATALLVEVHEDISIFVAPSQKIEGVKNVLDDVKSGDPQTILLLGSDRRLADIKAKLKPRSDTIIVVHLDPDKHATAIMSLPRDLKVEIPGHGTGRLNDAYRLGGANLTVRTVRALLSIDINHVVNMHFGGFQRAVNRVGCVFADVDRRYFNDNSGPQPDYAVIDLKAGYQKLCGQDALDYVRFRHEDSDFVRAARQQEFLRQAKRQIGLSKLFGDRKQLLRIFGTYTQTDIAEDDTAEIFGFIKLVYQSSKEPLTDIRFPATDAEDNYVEISADDLIETVERFIDVRGKDPLLEDEDDKPEPRRVKAKKGLARGLIAARVEGENHVLSMDLRLDPLGLPVYFPAVRVGGRGSYSRNSGPRSYEIFDRDGKRYRAYRIVLFQGDVGEYYGVQGTTWKAAPILADPDDEVRMRGRTYKRYFDGRKIRMIAWATPKAVYWVSNTLTKQLSNPQMMDIARSLQRIQG